MHSADIVGYAFAALCPRCEQAARVAGEQEADRTRERALR